MMGVVDFLNKVAAALRAVAGLIMVIPLLLIVWILAAGLWGVMTR